MDSAVTRFSSVTGHHWPAVRYFTTTRHGGFSQGEWSGLNLAMHCHDDPHHVARNRALLTSVVPAQPVWLNQVHGTTVFNADSTSSLVCSDQGQVPQADAAITTVAGRVLAVLTADCLPVVIADTRARVLGVAHAGWRGLAGGVLENTLAAMRDAVPEADAWQAWVGPGIGQSQFQVGAEVMLAFTDQDPGCASFFRPDSIPGKWRANLAGLAVRRLSRAGVARVEACPDCTFALPDRYYSYRRQGQTGRMATVAWLEPRGLT